MGVFSKWLESLDYDIEILSSCTRHASTRSTCQKCVSHCNYQAISIVKGKPFINRDLCVKCGICIAACPVQAISGIYPKRTIIQNKLIMEGNPPSVKELLILRKKGITTILGDSETLMEKWQQPLEEANAVLSKFGEEPFLIEKGTIAEEIHVSRRELLSFWRKESKSVVTEITPAKWRFNHSDLDLSKYYRDVQFVKITIDTEKCTLCGVCQKLCPKHCFKIQEDKFFISPQGCENCRLCTDTCPEKAVKIVDRISKSEKTLFPVFKKVCGTCQETFITLKEQDEECIVCKKREIIQRKMKRA